MNHWGFCDRCGTMTEFPAWKVRVCYACELGMNSIGAMLDPPWARPMTTREVWLADQWVRIEKGNPEPVDRRRAS